MAAVAFHRIVRGQGQRAAEEEGAGEAEEERAERVASSEFPQNEYRFDVIALAKVCARATSVCSRVLSYDGGCWRMRTYADLCGRIRPRYILLLYDLETYYVHLLVLYKYVL